MPLSNAVFMACSRYDIVHTGGDDTDEDAPDDDDIDDDDSDDDLDVPFVTITKRNTARQLAHWVKEQVNKGETEDEFAARARLMVDRGVNAQAKIRASRKLAGRADPEGTESIAVGTAARLYFESVHGKADKKPKSIVGHEDLGPALGRKYKFQWKDVGYGSENVKEAWKSPDWAGKYPDLIETYEKAPPLRLTPSHPPGPIVHDIVCYLTLPIGRGWRWRAKPRESTRLKRLRTGASFQVVMLSTTCSGRAGQALRRTRGSPSRTSRAAGMHP